ncbi:MAG: FAD-dependent oxidoreductase, partial [Planctomycetaceae bacterium]|nr:FAD-dependent oxidoreductase [Planctomycetaceae bacterium]
MPQERNINRRQYLGTLGLASAVGLAGNAFAETSMSVHGGASYETEILVCGGGPAGFAAATNAARLGRKVLLLERYGRLGGMGIHARVFPLLGSAASPFVKEVHKKTGGTAFDLERLDLIYADMLEEADAAFFLHVWATEPLMEGSRIVGVKAISKEGPLTIRAKLVIDATGDGDIAVQAGAPFEMGREKDGLVQPMSIMFTIRGLHDNAQTCGSEEQARQRRIGDETWEDVVTRAQKNGELPPTVGVVRTYQMKRKGAMIVNATQINRVSGTKVADLTKAELECRRQAFKIVDFMKKYLPGYEDAYITNMPAVIGVRETRRITGLDRLVREDLISGRKWDNAIVRGATFVIDIHNPDGSGQAENQTQQEVQGTAARVQPYDIPLTCMIPQKVEGL